MGYKKVRPSDTILARVLLVPLSKHAFSRRTRRKIYIGCTTKQIDASWPGISRNPNTQKVSITNVFGAALHAGASNANQPTHPPQRWSSCTICVTKSQREPTNVSHEDVMRAGRVSVAHLPRCTFLYHGETVTRLFQVITIMNALRDTGLCL